MKIFLLAALLLISACTTKSVDVLYTSNWREQWQNAVMNKCKQESQMLTFHIIDAKISAGYDVTQEDVDVLEKMLYQSCLKYHNMFI
jgi:hypothetical protein